MNTNYPYQTEQDLIDRYLEIPALERPPFEVWVGIQAEADMAIITGTFKPFMDAMIEFFNTEITPYFNRVGKEVMLQMWIAANDQAARRRRKWHIKPSLISHNARK